VRCALCCRVVLPRHSCSAATPGHLNASNTLTLCTLCTLSPCSMCWMTWMPGGGTTTALLQDAWRQQTPRLPPCAPAHSTSALVGSFTVRQRGLGGGECCPASDALSSSGLLWCHCTCGCLPPWPCPDMLEAMQHTAAEMPAELKDLHRWACDAAGAASDACCSSHI
jgi:hypothetical protein